MNKHITQAEFAKQRGVNRSTVTRWIQNGRMTTLPNGLIDPETATRELDATESPLPHHQARKAQFDAQRGQSAAAPPCDNHNHRTASPSDAPSATPSAEKIGTALKLETYRLQKAKAEQANIEIDKMIGALVDRAEVDFLLADLGSLIRAQLENLADRVSGSLAACKGDTNCIHDRLNDFAREILAEMADTIQRKSEDLTR
jgi:transcriptional regulator with XRE-family HTH domain